MAVVERTTEVDEAGLAALRTPRSDLLTERVDGTDQWTIESGPFKRYQRVLTVSDLPATATGTPRYRVTERTDYKIGVPLWWPYLWLPFRLALADQNRTPRRRWWWPREVVTAETATLIAHLGTIGMMAGFMGVLIGQTITFAARDFGVAVDAQANTLAAVRVGVLLSFFFLRRADSAGRRPLILRFAFTAIIFTFAGALSPNMFALGASQTVARGLTTGLLTLITLASTEEVPASSRALSISFMTLCTGFGAALVVWLLRLADLFDGAWRLSYIFPLLFLPLLWWINRQLPETRRYTAAVASDAPGPINWFRFTLISSSAFLSALYLSPASQLRNDFLTDDRSFSAGDVSMFQLVVSLPATVAVPIGGFIADRYGRRWLGASALAGSAIFSAISYQSQGLILWLTAALSLSLGAAALTALRGYQVELFPTKARGKVGGMIDVIGVAGSTIGLVFVGQLAVRWNDLGSAIGVLVAAPLIVAVVILVAYPETAGRELEEFNPEDPRLNSS
ncbi:MAG: MFS transporter [Acidimicrobiales bacterium]